VFDTRGKNDAFCVYVWGRVVRLRTWKSWKGRVGRRAYKSTKRISALEKIRRLAPRGSSRILVNNEAASSSSTSRGRGKRKRKEHIFFKDLT
jgi:hypothetical protein